MYTITKIEYKLINRHKTYAASISNTNIITGVARLKICKCGQSYPTLTKSLEGELHLPIRTNVKVVTEVTLLFDDYQSLVNSIRAVSDLSHLDEHILAHSIYCTINNGEC